MSEVGSSVDRTGKETTDQIMDGTMNNSEAPALPVESTSSKPSKRKLIAFIGAGVLLVAAGTAGAFAINHSNNVKAYDAAVAASNTAAQQILDAEADYPQAAYLLVESWNGAAQKNFGEFKSISVAPEALISKKTNAPLVEWVAPLEKRYSDKEAILELNDGEVVELHAEVSKTLKDESAKLEPKVAKTQSDSASGAVVNGGTVKKAQADAVKRTSEAKTAQSTVDELEGYLDEFDSHTVTGAEKHLTAPAVEALKNKDKYAEPFTKATQQAKDEYAKRATALQAAVDAFTGAPPAKPAKADEKPAAETKAVEVKQESVKPTATERLHFKHTPEKSKPTFEASTELRSTLAAFVASASALKTTHDKTVADEAAAAAAAEQAAAEAAAAEAASAASGGGGYTDPGTGNWVPSGGGGWTGGGGGGGGGGWTPPAGGGGGGGGYVPPPSTGCAGPPAGWFPSGGTMNGCPTYLPPGGGDTGGW